MNDRLNLELKTFESESVKIENVDGIFLLKQNIGPLSNFVQASSDSFSQLIYSDILDQIYGNVLVAGIGLGVTLMLLAEDEKVKSIDALDIDINVLKAFANQNYRNDKITLFHNDFLGFEGEYDFIIIDAFPFPLGSISAKGVIISPDWEFKGWGVTGKKERWTPEWISYIKNLGETEEMKNICDRVQKLNEKRRSCITN